MDFYILLGLERAASLGDIKRAYKRLARKYHPDINPGDRLAEAQFRQIAEAYETLIDPDRRRRYDSTGSASAPVEPAPFGFEGFDFSVSVSGSSASTFGDLFADVLDQRDARRQDANAVSGRRPPSDDYDRVRSGGSRRPAPADRDAAGALPHLPRRGLAAGGRDALPLVLRASGPSSRRAGTWCFRGPARSAVARGVSAARAARTCAGQQIEMRTEPLALNVPAGLADGARIRVPGKGHVGRNGGESGDLYITVHVEPHPLFHREGDDLHVTMPIAVHEAALGARIEVPSLDGPVRLRVPPGTQSGQRFRLRDRGVPSPRDARRGDLVVEARLVLPKVLDERSKELLREFGRINGEDVRRDVLHTTKDTKDTKVKQPR